MPIKIPNNLPAKEILNNENVFVMPTNIALKQDIRPLKILILNLMPLKITTETQLLRLLGNTPLQVEVELLHTITHNSKNTPKKHLLKFYKDFDEVKHQKFDGMIITGAPIEHLDFDKITYWEELKKIMDWSKENVTSTLHICWGANAGLYHHYGIKKHILDNKIFGVFPHKVTKANEPLLRGFDDIFFVPHSRYAEIRHDDIKKTSQLEILSESDISGIYIVASKDRRQLFTTGHSEYETYTLKEEYERDIQKGINMKIPHNYFLNDNPNDKPVVSWRAHASLLFSNWLNYYVYQETPYDFTGEFE